MSDLLPSYDRRSPRPARGRDAGFTLVELVIVVTIIAVLAALAAPSVANLMAGQRSSGAATDIFIALATARSEATKRNVDVTLSQKTGGWQNGWEILDPADGSKQLLDHGALVTGAVSGSLASVVFQGSGRISGTTKPTFAVTSSLGGATATKYVCLDLSGRPLVQATSCP